MIMVSNNKNNDIIIDFEPISRRVNFSDNKKSLYHLLTEIDVKIRSECGGAGTCGKCQFILQKGAQYLNPPTDSEKKILTEEDLSKGKRLACQTKILPHYIERLRKLPTPQFVVYLPDSLLMEDFQILTNGINKGMSLNPSVRKLYLKIDSPSLDHPIADLERTLHKISSKNSNRDLTGLPKFDYSVLQKLPQILRENDSEITLTLWNEKRIIDIESQNTSEQCFGIAFDIGTTTIVGYLMNLIDGKIYAVHSKLNPQTVHGEDVITRITYVKDHEDGQERLNSLVVEALNDIIAKTCQKAAITPSHIYEATIVGNSVMHHMFLNLDSVNIGLSPYIPVIQQGINLRAKDINLNIAQNGNVYALPLIAGFVGADTMGVIISSEIYKEDALTLAIDIGTNGELIIGNKDVIVTGSCAAGSALEGAHIKHGMRAAAGSIDSIKIDPSTLDASYTTIKNKRPIGICGSGLIDAVSEMLKAKILTRRGSFNKEKINDSHFIKKGKSLQYIIANSDETPMKEPITLSVDDVRQIQMAKGAFYSATRLMLQHLNDQFKDKNYHIEQVFLAGAFGNYIDKENARFIGMIPDIESEKIYQIGNAAGTGAQICLINQEQRNKAQELRNEIEYIEISVKKKFQREYAEAMYFPHMNLDLFPNLKEYEDIPVR
ncbi:MAG: DUF4445 domain-containing protein [Candidatus Lokiarchaeota archaeon]|nr:DUF4445 domain-containing protein [Candidatus Lokiarchaeota archaeon]